MKHHDFMSQGPSSVGTDTTWYATLALITVIFTASNVYPRF